MTAKRVASARKSQRPTIVAALEGFGGSNWIKRATKLAEAINRESPDDAPQDVESILFIAIMTGIDLIEDIYLKGGPRIEVPIPVTWQEEATP